MAAKVVIGATLQADGSQANETVKSFKAQLREANQELLKMQEEFGELSGPAIQAAKKVAELKDTIGDAQSLVDTFNPDRKFQAFGQSVQGVVGGFTALQGVMGLVGSDSEEVEKALLKVQSALAISQGLDDIREAQQGFKNLGAMIQQSTFFIKANEMANKAAAFTMKLFGGAVDTTSTSFKFLKGAIAATGIGVLLILVTEAISYFNNLTTAAQRAAEAEKEALMQRTKFADADLQGRLGAIAREEQLSQARLKKQGASEKELYEDQQSWQRIKVKSLEDHLQEVTGDEKKAQETRDKLKEERNKLELNQLNYEASINQKARDEQRKDSDAAIAEAKRKTEEITRQKKSEVDAAKKLNEELKAENEVSQAGSGRSSEVTKLLQEYEQKAAVLKAGNQSLLELDLWFNEQKKAIDKKYWEEEQQRRFEVIDAQLQKEQEAAQAQIDNRNNMYQAIKEASANLVNDESLSWDMRRQLIEEAEQRVLASTQFTEEQKTAAQKAFSDARIAIEEQERNARTQFMSDIGNAAGALSDLIGKQTAVGKGLAVAQATINTWQGATEVLKAKSVLPEPAATISKAINFAAVVATGLKAVKSILSVKVAGSGGGGGVSTPSVNTTAPLTPQLQTTQTQLNQNSINALGNQATRAYVVESDVSNDQEKIRRLNRAARL